MELQLTYDGLEDHLADMNDNGIAPVVVGTSATGQPFLAYGWAPGGDGWDVGIVTDNPHPNEFDYGDTDPCPECRCPRHRPLESLAFPVTILAEVQPDD